MVTSYIKKATKSYFQYAKSHQILVDYKSRFYGLTLSVIGWAIISTSLEFIDDEVARHSFFLYIFIKFSVSVLFYYIFAKSMKINLDISDSNLELPGSNFNIKTRKFFLYTRGVLAVASYITFLWSSRRVGLVDDSTIFGIDPVIYGLFMMGFILKEKLSLSSWVGIIIATSGVLLVFIVNGIDITFHKALYGILIGLVSSFAYSIIFVMNSTMIQHEPAVRMAFYEAAVGFFFSLFLLIINIDQTIVAIRVINSAFVIKSAVSAIMYSVSMLLLFHAFLFTEVILISTSGYSLDIFSSVFSMLKNHAFNLFLALTNGLIILGTSILYSQESKRQMKNGSKFFRPTYRNTIIKMYENLEKLCVDKKISISNYNHAKREYNNLLFKFAEKTKKKKFSIELSDGNVSFTIKDLGIKLIADGSLKSTSTDVLNFDLSKISIVRVLIELTTQALNIIDYCPHTGLLPLSIATRNKKVKIYASEPVSFIKSMLDKNIECNQVENIFLCKYKFSNMIGGEIFYYQPDEAILVPKDQACIYTGLEEMACNLTTIDQFVEENKMTSLDFVGGGSTGDELLKLQGAEKAVKKFKPIIYLEIENASCLEYGYKSEEILKLLKSWDYRYFVNSKIDNNVNYFLFLDENRYKQYENSTLIENFTREYKIY